MWNISSLKYKKKLQYDEGELKASDFLLLREISVPQFMQLEMRLEKQAYNTNTLSAPLTCNTNQLIKHCP